MLTTKDLELITLKGITEKSVEEQLASIERGFPYLTIIASASPEKGIMVVPDEERLGYIREWDEYLAAERKIIKFVPASGAASRMFKDLYAFLDADYDEPLTEQEKQLFERIGDFPFFSALDAVCMAHDGKSVEELVAEGRYKRVVSLLLGKEGLNYGQLPKGLLLFHKYSEKAKGIRTAFEEHLAEGAMYAKTNEGNVNIHFTILPEHEVLFRKCADEKLEACEELYSVRYNLTYNYQKPSTDTIAVDMENRPFRDGNGNLVFRPGGHGALIDNLNDMDFDVAFIKNVDNVNPDGLRHATVLYKKILGGVLVRLQRKIFEFLNIIEGGKYSHKQIEDMIHFLHDELCVRNGDLKDLEDAELILYIKKKLNRPLRVCGMVKNVGEPGGGPFLVVNPDKTVSPQILESSQIDLKREDMRAIFEKGTHFNPVDLVCAIKDYKGNKFDLHDYVDRNTGFISVKSKDGRELKALELPGLWNGAMSDWNTVFVEVPISTFTPVKTVFDLLRPEHQG